MGFSWVDFKPSEDDFPDDMEICYTDVSTDDETDSGGDDVEDNFAGNGDEDDGDNLEDNFLSDTSDCQTAYEVDSFTAENPYDKNITDGDVKKLLEKPTDYEDDIKSTDEEEREVELVSSYEGNFTIRLKAFNEKVLSDSDDSETDFEETLYDRCTIGKNKLINPIDVIEKGKLTCRYRNVKKKRSIKRINKDRKCSTCEKKKYHQDSNCMSPRRQSRHHHKHSFMLNSSHDYYRALATYFTTTAMQVDCPNEKRLNTKYGSNSLIKPRKSAERINKMKPNSSEVSNCEQKDTNAVKSSDPLENWAVWSEFFQNHMENGSCDTL